MFKSSSRSFPASVALMVVIVAVALAQNVETPDPVLNFYVERAGAVFVSHDPVGTGTAYSFTAASYYKKITSDGRVTRIDSAITDYYFSFGHLDSQKTRRQTADRFKNIDFEVPNVFRERYRFNFFPNDTGGAEIAIGFDAPTADDPAPVGLAFVDRAKYVMRRLVLYYPNKKNYRRFSRLLWFTDYQGRNFPDSVCEVGARYGFFSTDYYRLETKIGNYQIYRR